MDFANQAGSLMGQPKQIELLPPADMTKEAGRPEQTTSGVRAEWTKILKTKTNVFDLAMQGRRIINFEFDGTYQNPRWYDSKVVFRVKLVHSDRHPTAGQRGQGYQMFQVLDDDGTEVDSKYGPIILPNFFAEFFWEKANIELKGGIELEPTNQKAQLTKMVDFYMNLSPEDAEFFYSNMGGYVKEYEATTEMQKYGVPLAFTNGAVSANTTVNYKKIKQAKFTGGTSSNVDFHYTTKRAAKLATNFNLGVEQQFEVPLRHLSRVADCKQMFPSGKDYILSLYKAKEDFSFTCADGDISDNVILQLTGCEIHVPIVELQPEKQNEERQKIASQEGIAYFLKNTYLKNYYVYRTDTTRTDVNVTDGYRPMSILIYWVDYSFDSDGLAGINNYILERPNLKSIDMYVDDQHVKGYEPKHGEDEINWDFIYQEYIKWTGRSLCMKNMWMHGKMIIPIKLDPNPQSQVQNSNMFTPWKNGVVDIKTVYRNTARDRQLRMCVQWKQSQRLIFNNMEWY